MSTTTSSRGRPRRTRPPAGAAAAAARLEELTAAREQLDARLAERRRREDDALAAYAATAGEAEQIAVNRDAAVAEAERARQAAVADADAQLGDLERRQTAVLVELNELGRSADELHALFGIPVKKVRALLRAGREHPIGQQTDTTATAEQAATSENPSARDGHGNDAAVASEPTTSDEGQAPETAA
ncbi:translation initiation factor IF-2 [Pseudonocardia sp. WMMC193]|uniref:translation initiation factor IF-2 n=1 Tax=Pseudonocardia sp. WMMC193 TaxID=2911965 RepID=UPI001F4646C6|nr:translation initiation factor IF-2 [Pseudonocardia sp. WMMC193]MCF7547315.1 translation initiation factor IF-2 [Pseudonocardia sp. WMMC193]